MGWTAAGLSFIKNTTNERIVLPDAAASGREGRLCRPLPPAQALWLSRHYCKSRPMMASICAFAVR